MHLDLKNHWKNKYLKCFVICYIKLKPQHLAAVNLLNVVQKLLFYKAKNNFGLLVSKVYINYVLKPYCPIYKTMGQKVYNVYNV